MNTLGIIAEYNPFHKGHRYALEKLKKKVNADYVVVVMSGDYTQRGCPAIFDKYTRTRMALSCGADLVLELPIYYSTGSAEFFAGGAVSILNALGCIDYLGFGSESDDIDSLITVAHMLADESDELSSLIKDNVKAGMNYAAARANALSELNGIDASVISASNDILGSEYIKALKIQNSPITPVCIKRSGAGYHDAATTDASEFASAEAIRGIIHDSLKEAQSVGSNPDTTSNISVEISRAIDSISELIPLECFGVLKDSIKSNTLNTIDENAYSQLLFYRLLADRESGYTRYVDVNRNLSDKILSVLYKFENYSDFISLLKTKEITYTHISRALLHIMLGLTDRHLEEYTADRSAFVSYARILGLRTDASPLLKKIQECSRIPVISRLADSVKTLDDMQLRLLNETVRASNVYDLILGKTDINEYSKSVITLQ